MKTWALWLVAVSLAGDGDAGGTQAGGVRTTADNEAISNLPAAITTLPSRQEPTLKPSPESASPPPKRGAATPARRISPRSQNSRFVNRPRAAPDTDGGENSDAGVPEKEPSEAKLASSSRRLAWWSTTALGLAIVLAVIYAGGRALRSFVPGMRPDDWSGPVHVLYRAVLSPRQSACLIRCGDRLLLVGVGTDQMTTLTEITDPAEIDYLKGQCMQARPRSTTRAFRDLFKRSGDAWSEEESTPNSARTEASSPEPLPRASGHGVPGRAPSAPASPSPAAAGLFSQQLQAARAKVFGGKARAG